MIACCEECSVDAAVGTYKVPGLIKTTLVIYEERRTLWAIFTAKPIIAHLAPELVPCRSAKNK
jgi:hypothetical protein